MVKKVLPGYSKSVIWDTFYEIMFFAREEMQQSRKVDTKNHKAERTIHESRQMQ